MTLSDLYAVTMEDLYVSIVDPNTGTTIEEKWFCPFHESDIEEYKDYIVTDIRIHVYDYGEVLTVAINRP